MEFLPSLNSQAPRNLYPCLAQINIQPEGALKSRRLSAGSFGSDKDGGGNVIERVISGGRRKSSFGAAADGSTATDRRMSIMPSSNAGGEKGTWYWRVQVGVTDTHLVLLPLSTPPNPLLTHPPQPLSHAMPAHSTAAHSTRTDRHDEAGVLDKVKNLLRRASTQDKKEEVAATSAEQTGGVDRIVDQNAAGEQLPSAEGNAVGATNVNANAELGWPGLLNGGQKLGAVVVSLGGIDKNKLHLGGGSKKEASWVTVPITSHFAGMVQGMGEGNQNSAKSGTIRLEFDKEWIGAKAEAELVHHQITTAITQRGERAPEAAQIQLGGGAAPAAAPAVAPSSSGATETAYDESVASGQKVAGTA